jgi:hypothetical protein
MNNTQKYFAVFGVLIALLLAYAFLVPHQKEGDGLGARIDRAAEKIQEGVHDAAKEMKPENQKTFGEKVGDAIEDAGKSVKGTGH